MLLRVGLGAAIRDRRLAQGRTLRDVAERASVSLGYLSEIERGQKEASSELLYAVSVALDVELADLLREAADTLAAAAPPAATPALHAVAAA